MGFQAKKKGLYEYNRIKKKVDKKLKFSGYEKYLMEVHFPKVALPPGHPIAGTEEFSAKKLMNATPGFRGLVLT
jgi:hypothetical protein